MVLAPGSSIGCTAVRLAGVCHIALALKLIVHSFALTKTLNIRRNFQRLFDVIM